MSTVLDCLREAPATASLTVGCNALGVCYWIGYGGMGSVDARVMNEAHREQARALIESGGLVAVDQRYVLPVGESLTLYRLPD